MTNFATKFNNKADKSEFMVKQFIQNFREAFGQKATLPLLFGYSNQPVADTERINGCFFKGLQAAREGASVSLSAEVIACGGGKLYTGFTDMPERVPGFVSLKERVFPLRLPCMEESKSETGGVIKYI